MDIINEWRDVFILQGGDFCVNIVPDLNMYQMNEVFILTVLVTSIVAGAYGSLIGGGSLLMVPTLIFLGIPPHIAVATNRAGFMGLFFTSIYKFQKKKLINWKVGWTIGIPALLGAYFGANFLFQIDEATIKRIFGIIALVVLAAVLLRREIGLVARKRSTQTWERIAGIVCAFLAGFVGSMSGGVGTYLSYILLFFFGQTFLQSAGTRKVAGLLIALMAISVFIINDAIDYRIAGVMFVGTWIGAYIGVHYSEVIGNTWLKRGFVIIVGIMAVKMLL